MCATDTQVTQELIDVVDMQPIPGEYVHCKGKAVYEAFGEAVEAFHPIHAQRLVVSRHWDRRCECCNQSLRYCYVTLDLNGVYHCFGHTCFNVNTLGADSARRYEYSQKVDQKERGFCATFNAPAAYWQLERDQRPQFARVWKTEERRKGRRTGRQCWMLTIWADSFEQCTANCLAIDRMLGVKLY